MTRKALLIVLCLVLAACGGGGGSGSSKDEPSNTAPVVSDLSVWVRNENSEMYYYTSEYYIPPPYYTGDLDDPVLIPLVYENDLAHMRFTITDLELNATTVFWEAVNLSFPSIVYDEGVLEVPVMSEVTESYMTEEIALPSVNANVEIVVYAVDSEGLESLNEHTLLLVMKRHPSPTQ